MVKDVYRSLAALTWGVVSRFWFWLPFILLDATDYWERYIRGGIRSLTGRDVAIPDSALPALAVAGVVWAAFLTYHELRKQKLRQDEELAVGVDIDSTPTLQEWRTPDLDRLCRAYYVTVRNPSAKAVKGVGLFLAEITPHIANLEWLPIPLHIKHDNREPHRETFDMAPRSVRHIDVVSHAEGASTLTFEHTVNGVNKEGPSGTYILTIRAEGETVASPCEIKLLVKLDNTNRLVCLPGSYVDLDKGLIDFHRDAFAALGPLDVALTKQARILAKIGTVATRLTARLDEAQSKPIAIYESIIGIKTQADRARRQSAGWAVQIDQVASELRSSVEEYTIAANTAIQNFTGYAELATIISPTELQKFRELQQAMRGALAQIKVFRGQVLDNQKSRMLTNLTRSMRLLGMVIDSQIETTENITEAFGTVIDLAEGKSPQES